MKKMYVDPEAVVIQFDTEDIITMSGGDNEVDVGGDGEVDFG